MLLDDVEGSLEDQRPGESYGVFLGDEEGSIEQ